MYAFDRMFRDGTEVPELVLIHYTAFPEGEPGKVLARASLVVPLSREPGRREARLYLPEPPRGRRLCVSYRFSTVREGTEWFSPRYDLVVPGGSGADGPVPVEETGGGNLGPAPGTGTFRLRLLLRDGEPASGALRFGFGAMRKKPSGDLCRVRLPYGAGKPPVIDAPNALSVLKNCPMPYFLYHQTEGGIGLVAVKINNARVVFRDEAGDAACVRLLWSAPGWESPNVAVLSTRNLPLGDGEAVDIFRDEDPAARLEGRWAALSAVRVPRLHEGHVFGPVGGAVEYCFLVTRRRAGGDLVQEWRNRDGGNWTLTL